MEGRERSGWELKVGRTRKKWVGFDGWKDKKEMGGV